MRVLKMLALLVLAGLVAGPLAAQDKKAKARDLYLDYGGGNSNRPPRPNGNSAATGLPGTRVEIELLRDGKRKFVKPNYKFKSGDRIRLRLTTNFEGYISLLNIGSTGRVNALFPYPGADDRTRPAADVQIPKADDWIRFDDNPGTEVLTVIMSRRPIDTGASYRTRDLYVESTEDGTYLVCQENLLDEPMGFVLRLKHKKK